MHRTYPYIPSTLILVLLHNWTEKKILQDFPQVLGVFSLFWLRTSVLMCHDPLENGNLIACVPVFYQTRLHQLTGNKNFILLFQFFLKLLLLFSHCYLRIKAFSVHAIYISENKHWHLYLPLLSVQEYQLQTPTFVWFVIWIISNLINITKVRVLFNGIMFTPTVGCGTRSTVLVSPGEFEVADVARCFFLSKRTNAGA